MGAFDRAYGAHPRAGGENELKPGTCEKKCGSSPRGRGKRQSTTDLVYTRGLIPARAGKTICFTLQKP